MWREAYLDQRRRLRYIYQLLRNITQRKNTQPIPAHLPAEQQLRASVQTHRNVGYVFAGSKTSFLTEMTSDPSRPFYRTGERLFVGPLPRPDFLEFLRSAFESGGFGVDEDAPIRILDLAEDVPYNVQRLAHECWTHLRDTGTSRMAAETVEQVLDVLVRREDPFYTQIWTQLTAAQKKSLQALVEEGGKGLYTTSVLSRFDLALSTVRTALASLVRQGIAREEEQEGTIRYRLEDPFFAAWLRLFTVLPR